MLPCAPKPSSQFDYVTLMIDADERCVADVEEGRDKETVSDFCKRLVEKGGDPANIVAVTSDISR